MGEELSAAEGRAVEQVWRDALALQAAVRARAEDEGRGTVVRPVRRRLWAAREAGR